MKLPYSHIYVFHSFVFLFELDFDWILILTVICFIVEEWLYAKEGFEKTWNSKKKSRLLLSDWKKWNFDEKIEKCSNWKYRNMDFFIHTKFISQIFHFHPPFPLHRLFQKGIKKSPLRLRKNTSTSTSLKKLCLFDIGFQAQSAHRLV